MGWNELPMDSFYPANLTINDTTMSQFPVDINNSGADGSGTITTGGTAQSLFSGAIPPNGFTVLNPDPANYLWINIGGTASPNGSGCIPVPPLGGYETPPTYSPHGAISIYGGTTGQPFTAIKW